ncbi:MAG: hypothetical protein WD055_05625 [Candidatus Dependentiae bacterium]
MQKNKFFLALILLCSVELCAQNEEDSVVVAAEINVQMFLSHFNKTVFGWVTASAVGLYALYKCVDYKWSQSQQKDELNEEVMLLSQNDQGILIKFTDTMETDLRRLKEGDQTEILIESFDFSQMDDHQLAQEGLMVKRSFLHMYEQCVENPEKMAVLEGFYDSIVQDVQAMCAA